MNLHDGLLQKAVDQKLGHFYILESTGPSDISQNVLTSFVQNFIKDYYQKVEGQKSDLINLLNHPDIFVLGSLNGEDEKTEKFFKVEEAEALNRFFEFKPVQGLKKFALIAEGHKISPTVANKWLKLFEEPQGNSTIFLLNPRGGQLLPTIHSRAIHLRLPQVSATNDLKEWNEFVQDLNKLTLYQFLEQYGRGQKDLSYWVNQLILWESQQLDHMAPKDHLFDWLKTFKEMELFHQPTATKWTLFYSYLKENVLVRLSRV